MNQNSEKLCRECGTRLTGRLDKKFCSDQCRSIHNYHLNNEATVYMRRINFILRRNRRILSELNPSGRKKIPRERLKIKGFDFNYFTSISTNQTGVQFYYCYDYGYQMLERESHLLLVKKGARET